MSRHRHGRPWLGRSRSTRPVGSGRPLLPGRLVRAFLVLVVGGVAGAVFGDWWGLVPGLLLGGGAGWWLAAQPSAAERAWRRQLEADLPFAIDLLVSALRAGATQDAAARQVAQAVHGPAGESLTKVERALLLGAPADDAWTHLGDGDTAMRVARAAQRSGESGAALAGALARVVDDLRADALQAVDARTRASAVLIVLPLGLCFLPAFVLTGLVPVIVAVVGDLFTFSP
jgi:pilus assembly protein TadC